MWLHNKCAIENLPKLSLRDFLSLRHPNHFVLAGANNRNVIITHRFLAAPVQANRDFFWHTDFIAELWRAKRACGAPWVSNLPIPENLVITWPYTARPPATHPSAPQGNQWSIPHFLASLGAQEYWYCTHIAHQCCDQLTAVKTGSRWPVSPDRIGAQVSTHRGRVFFEVIRWQVTSFQMIAGWS